MMVKTMFKAAKAESYWLYIKIVRWFDGGYIFCHMGKM